MEESPVVVPVPAPAAMKEPPVVTALAPIAAPVPLCRSGLPGIQNPDSSSQKAATSVKSQKEAKLSGKAKNRQKPQVPLRRSKRGKKNCAK